jgi:hypothetical protein
MARFLLLIRMGVDAYNAFKQHKKVHESAMEDLSAGESYTLTKINSIANNLQQQIHDLCNNHRHLPQMAIGTQQHRMVTMGQGTWNTTLAMDICTQRDIPNTGPRANQELPPVAQPSGTVPHPTPSVSPVNQSTPALSTALYKMHHQMLNVGMAVDTLVCIERDRQIKQR